MESSLPATISASMVLHAAGLGAWLYMSQMSKRDHTRVLSNVELLIAARPGSVARRAAMPPSAWNFLKMALPSVRTQAPLDVQAAQAERRTKVMPAKLLQENKAKLQKSLDLGAEK